MKKASETRSKENIFKTQPLDRKHVIGYVGASAILLFGVMVAAIVYLKQREPMTALATLMPFGLVSMPIYVYLGLTQETTHDYGMNSKRALVYTLASEILLFGVVSAGIVYFQGQES